MQDVLFVYHLRHMLIQPAYSYVYHPRHIKHMCKCTERQGEKEHSLSELVVSGFKEEIVRSRLIKWIEGGSLVPKAKDGDVRRDE